MANGCGRGDYFCLNEGRGLKSLDQTIVWMALLHVYRTPEQESMF